MSDYLTEAGKHGLSPHQFKLAKNAVAYGLTEEWATRRLGLTHEQFMFVQAYVNQLRSAL